MNREEIMTALDLYIDAHVLQRHSLPHTAGAMNARADKLYAVDVLLRALELS